MIPFKWPTPKRERVEQLPVLDLNLEKEELTGIVQGYQATDIEERMYIAFLHNGVRDDDIEYQPSYLAGRNMSGEIRPDFALHGGGRIQVWYADEEYFHKTAEQQAKDRFNDAILFEMMDDAIEWPIRIPGDDLETQELADEAIAEWVR